MEPQPTSTRRFVGPVIVLLKRIIRRAIRWYVAPQMSRLEGRVAELQHRLDPRPYVNPEFIRGRPNPAAGGQFDLAEFQNKFRGPSRVIQDKLRFYVPRFLGRRVIVDVGCGRGEFLELLHEAGLSAIGVEDHAEQAAECRRKGLNVVQADLFDYLASLADDSIDAVFSAQVIEHISFSKLTDLLSLCYRKLKPGAILIAETVNPHCLGAFKFFYLDPTHVTMLYPEVLQLLGESAGFAKVQIVYPVAPEEAMSPYHECGEYAMVAEK